MVAVTFLAAGNMDGDETVVAATNGALHMLSTLRNVEKNDDVNYITGYVCLMIFSSLSCSGTNNIESGCWRQYSPSTGDRWTSGLLAVVPSTTMSPRSVATDSITYFYGWQMLSICDRCPQWFLTGLLPVAIVLSGYLFTGNWLGPAVGTATRHSCAYPWLSYIVGLQDCYLYQSSCLWVFITYKEMAWKDPLWVCHVNLAEVLMAMDGGIMYKMYYGGCCLFVILHFAYNTSMVAFAMQSHSRRGLWLQVTYGIACGWVIK